MPDHPDDCLACGEPLRLRDGADRCVCPLCGACHLVDRGQAPPSIRLAGPREIPEAMTRARRELKEVQAGERFIQGDVSERRRTILWSLVALAVPIAVGAALIANASFASEEASNDPDASKGTFLMPTMSKQSQTIFALRAAGVVLLGVGLLVAVLLPWRRWREPGRALRVVRGNRTVLEALVRRLSERAPAP